MLITSQTLDPLSLTLSSSLTAELRLIAAVVYCMVYILTVTYSLLVTMLSLSWLRAATESSFCRFTTTLKLKLHRRLISAPRAFPFRADVVLDIVPSVASLSGARFRDTDTSERADAGRTLGEGILPARSVGWSGEIVDLGHIFLN